MSTAPLLLALLAAQDLQRPVTRVPATPQWPEDSGEVSGAMKLHADPRWTFSLRSLPGVDVERARLDLALAYQVTPRFSVGIDWAPEANDVGVNARWLAVPETDTRPGLVVGTGPDRLGTPSGRAVYALLSKDLEDATGLAIAPFVGLAYGDHDEEVDVVGGVVIRWNELEYSTHLWDGHGLQNVYEFEVGDTGAIGALLADVDGAYEFGLTFRMDLAMPWERSPAQAP
ncbi:MAG: hypothetical protein U1F29_02425 [Planctomycetota bacterium]